MLDAFPGCEKDPAYVRFLVMLIADLVSKPSRGADPAEGGEEVVVDAARVAAAMEEESRYGSGNLRGDDSTGRFLERFRDDVMPGLRVNRSDWRRGRARSIDREHLRGLIPHMVSDAWVQEISTPAREIPGRVYLSTGTPYGKDTKYREGKRRERVLDRYELEAPNRVARKVYRLMRDVPKQQFSRLAKDGSLNRGRQAAAELRSPEARAYALAAIRQLEDHAWQSYGFSRYSPRVFGQGYHLALVHSSVRRAILADCVELDLRSAQLAIAARDWGLPMLTRFLQSGQSVWRELVEWLGLDFCPASKGAVKRGTYALVYGAGESRIVSDMQDEYETATGSLLRASTAGRLLTHPLMREAFESRTEQLETIQRDGGALDCFGNWICDGKRYGGDPSRSILAQVAQARELWLMEPVVDACLQDGGAVRSTSIVLWQHDGVSVRPTRMERGKKAVAQLRERVRRRAAEGGYPTALEAGCRLSVAI